MVENVYLSVTFPNVTPEQKRELLEKAEEMGISYSVFIDTPLNAED